MEIPAGKWCSKCPLCHYDNDDRLYYCNHSKFAPHVDHLQDVLDASGYEWKSIRCKPCLSAYPNGAVITITAKEKE
jgi:hypothetical protein